MTEPADLRSDPEYAEGFYDAADMQPLHDGMGEAYTAGWRACMNAKLILEKYGFTQTAAREYSRTLTLQDTHQPATSTPGEGTAQ